MSAAFCGSEFQRERMYAGTGTGSWGIRVQSVLLLDASAATLRSAAGGRRGRRCWGEKERKSIAGWHGE